MNEAIDLIAECTLNEADGVTETASADGSDWYSDAAYATAASYSEAASTLHMYLHNSEAAYPKWIGIDEMTTMPLYSDGIATEGMAILRHMAGWRARLSDEHLSYLAECELAEAAGINPSSIRPSHRMGSGKYERRGMIRAGKIGFNRAELISFLMANNIVRSQDTIKPAHGHKAATQRRLILSAINELGYDPQALPPENGLPGVKKKVRDLLESRKHQEFMAETALNNAWKELRRLKKICFAGQ
nr:hypothetical protein [Pseudomonas sp.]